MKDGKTRHKEKSQKLKEKEFIQKSISYVLQLWSKNSKNYIYISYKYSFYYTDKVYISYQPRIGLKIISEKHYMALMDKLNELNLDPENKIQGFIQGGMTELGVKNNIIKIPQEWRDKFKGKDIKVSITKDEILVADARKSVSVYTGKELGGGGAWVSLKK